MTTKKRQDATNVDPVNEPGETVEVVSDPDSDPGPTAPERDENGKLPNEPDYLGPGTYVEKGERLDWPKDCVCYTGQFGAYEISAAQWAQAGVSDQASVRWDASNGYALPKEAFTDSALRALIANGFHIT